MCKHPHGSIVEELRWGRMGEVHFAVTFRPGATARWDVSLDQEPRVHASGRSVSAARNAIRYAAGLWAHVDAGDLILKEHIRLPPEVQVTVEMVLRRRQEAEVASRAAQLATHEAVRALVRSHKFSVRDTAEVLGISFSRVAQILREGEGGSSEL